MSALTNKTFFSRVKNLGSFPAVWDNETIKNEPMFFNCDRKFCEENGGPITKAFLAALPEGWENVVIDSRCHMLMPGWFPCIPGYHHDDVPRPAIPVGQHFLTASQPDYENPRYKSEHILGLVNAEICPTEFALGECEMPAVPEGELIYRKWHPEVLKQIDNGNLHKYNAESGKILYFDWQTFHQGTKAVGNGWRWFIRLTRNSDRVNTPTNEIRKQVQVYLEFPMEGW